MKPTATDYSMTNKDANELKGVVLLPIEFRRELLKQYARDRGIEALVELFANFIGMANSVVENANEAVYLLGIIEGDMHPHQAEKINTPSLFGALQGVELANEVNQSKTCEGCAFRRGTLANQSPSTTTDAHWVLGCDDDRFMCHEHMDAQGNPTTPCGGHSQILKRRELVA